jgi:hypothetical protein
VKPRDGRPIVPDRSEWSANTDLQSARRWRQNGSGSPRAPAGLPWYWQAAFAAACGLLGAWGLIVGLS